MERKVENEKESNKNNNDEIDSNNEEDEQDYYTIDNDYKIALKEILGGGSFGQIYKCISLKNNEEYAVKIESNSSNIPQLAHEYKILKALEGGGIPKCHFYKIQGMDTILIMDLLGYNLEDILQATKSKKFSLKTSLMIIDQMITRLNYLHYNGYLHRDLKPENFVIGKVIRDNIIYLIDYGLAKKYIDPKTHEHIPFKENRPIIGTIRYISPNTHKGWEQSRRDDLISLCYILIYFLEGQLPWDNIKCKTREEKYTKILECKASCSNETLCKNYPGEIINFFNYIFELEFDETPNYNYLHNVILKTLDQNNLYNDTYFDWMSIELLEYPIVNIKDIKKKKREERLLAEQKKEEKEEKNKIEKKKEAAKKVTNEILKVNHTNKSSSSKEIYKITKPAKKRASMPNKTKK